MEPLMTTSGVGRATAPMPAPGRAPAATTLPGEWARTPVLVVMPTYNEAGALPGVVAELMALPLSGLRLLVVDDASPDGTGRIAEGLARRYAVPGRPARVTVLHRPAKLGLGRAYVAGMRRARELVTEPGSSGVAAGYVVQMDADGSHPAAALPVMLGVARSTGAGLVVGSRYVAGGRLAADWERHRRMLSRGANVYAGALLGTGIRDLTGGFNLWREEALRAAAPQEAAGAGYAFQVELKHRAVVRGVRVVEVPIRFGARRAGHSKLSAAVQWEAALLPWRLLLRRR
ncbi:polyprenol monophosphomannose synthase [Streptomyces sp. ST2-7A]|uniref:polyprenol monophosphomannose synthase n=1 Tax=Streptomyces sp. ST2-7A TaxID=2907214 RepID=UPI001F2AE980|nr:polyprenol monophosphomannose synthase [Streptomyces sp. ST2-7A]MCE7082388.1 polyprenol monophosphomannose synthase [Streptomyces sp. ST2-7A]